MWAVAPVKQEPMACEETVQTYAPLPMETRFNIQALDRDEEMEILHAIKQETEESTRDRLVDSLAASYPSGQFSKVFRCKEEDKLSSSCFAEIRLDKGPIDDSESDDDLTSLAWLQDADLLRGMRVSDCDSPFDGDAQKENTNYNAGYYGQPHPPHVPYNPQKHINSKPPYSFSCLIFMAIEDNTEKKLPVKDIYHWILSHFPYFQNAPTGWKNSVRHNLSLNKCFKKVEKDRCSNIGKGSLWMIDPDFRPNLLQALRKTPYHPYHQLQMFNNNTGTTSLYVNNGNQKPLPLQPRPNVNTPSPHLFPFLSRRLAQSNFANSGTNISVSEIVSDIDVANTLVSLKRAAESRRVTPTSRSRSPSPPEFGSEREKELLKQKKLRASSRDDIVLYAPPSNDHMYCVTETLLQRQAMSPESSIDEEYEFGANDKSTSEGDDELFSESDYDEEGWSEEEELYEREKLKIHSKAPIITQDSVGSQAGKTRAHSGRRIMVRDPEEDLKIAEGANALLNLAGIRSAHIVPLRSISPSHNNNNNIKIQPMDT